MPDLSDNRRCCGHHERLRQDEPLTFISEEDGVFSFENYTGITVTVNTVTDQLTSENLDELCYFETSENSDLQFFVKPGDKKYTQSPKTNTFDFSLYGIDLRADENDVWVPDSTLCDCFMNSDSSAAVIGKEIYRFGLDDTEEYNCSARITHSPAETICPRS